MNTADLEAGGNPDGLRPGSRTVVGETRQGLYPAPLMTYSARYVLMAGGMQPGTLQAVWRYLVAYQSTLGQSFHDAVRLCPEEQDVITVVNPGLDQVAWLKLHTRANLDIVRAASLKQLSEIMKKRVASDRRFGPPWSAGINELRLKWPVSGQPHVILRAFGAPRGSRPSGEDRDLPFSGGHEGWDLVAPPGTNIVASAGGFVLDVELDPAAKPHGCWVRLEHRLPDGETYHTVYGRLGEVLVAEGDPAEVGQPVGLAGSTGEPGLGEAGHLHFQVQWLGATQRGYRDPWGRLWSQNNIWPGSRMIDAYSYQTGAEPPPAKGSQEYAGPPWEPGVALVGICYPEEGHLDYRALRDARFEAVRFPMRVDPVEVDDLRRRVDDPAIVVHLAPLGLGVEPGERLSPASCAERLTPVIAPFYRRGVRLYELDREPNTCAHGYGKLWRNGREYAVWWLAVRNLLANAFPLAKWGFPGLSVSAHLEDGQEMWSFLSQAKGAIQQADWVSIFMSWRSPAERAALIVDHLGVYRERLPTKLLMVTEFRNDELAGTLGERGGDGVGFFRMVRRIPGLAAAFHLTGSGPSPWYQAGVATVAAIKLGSRVF